LFQATLRACYLIAFAAAGWLLVQGSSYYLTPLAERAHHPGYWDWKPGGQVGHALGVAGSTLMVLMLGYSLRKRVGALRRLGSMSRWLDVHMLFGVAGPLLVVLHSSFKVQGLVALSFWSMIAVAASGVFGRYLYLQIPRTRAGEEMNLAALERVDAALNERLRTEFRLGDSILSRLEELAAGPPAEGGLTRTLVRILADDVTRAGRLRAFARACRGVPVSVRQEFQRVLREKAEARRRILLWSRLHDLFHYWHVAHKPFAVVMYVFMVLHVAVALWAGYAWGAP
jgi:hypothetical protein